MSEVKFLDLVAQYESIRPDIDQAVLGVLAEAAFVGGKHVSRFEKNFASFIGVANCIGVGNGTDALEIAIEALELPRGSEILVPANSFVATSEAVTRSGHRVVFVDCDPSTYLIDIEQAVKRATSQTKAIIPVHLYGQPVNMPELMDVAREHGWKVIEDCAQAHGAEYDGQRVGSFGDLSAFSFYPGKNLGAYGDGGAIVCSDRALATRCRMIANHGRVEKYNHVFEGRNSRLDGLQAAILDVKLSHLDSWIDRRGSLAAIYRERLNQSTRVDLPAVQQSVRHAYHLFVVEVEDRPAVTELLKRNRVACGVHYPIALPLLEAYEYLQHQPSDFPAATAAQSRLLSLPIYPELPDEAVHRVCDLLAGG